MKADDEIPKDSSWLLFQDLGGDQDSSFFAFRNRNHLSAMLVIKLKHDPEQVDQLELLPAKEQFRSLLF